MMKTTKLFYNPLFNKYKADVYEQNFITLKNTSFSGIIISTGLVIITAFEKVLGSNFILYSGWLLFSLVFFMLCSFCEKAVKKKATSFLYVFTLIMYSIATAAGTYFFKESNASVAIGYLAIMPFIIFDQVGNFCVYEIFMCLFLCGVSITVKPHSIAIIDCLNAIGFGFLSCLIGAKTINIKLSSIESKYELIKQRDTDHLTGLYSRSAAEKHITDWLKDGNGTAAFIIIDLDNFKRINDTMGHLIGDKALVSSANAIKKVFKGNECLARWGGDEFLVFLCEDMNYAEKKTCELIKTISIPIIDGEHTYSVSASVGMTECHPGDDFDDIYRQADSALYHSKDKGRNCYSISESEK